MVGDSSTGEVIGGEKVLRVGIAFARTAIFAMSRLLAREEILRLKHDPLKVKVSLRRTPEEEERKARKKKRRRERRESSQADTTHASREDTTKKMADTEDGTHKDPGGEETVADGDPHDASRGPKLKQTADTVWDEPVFLERVGVWAGPFVLAGD